MLFASRIKESLFSVSGNNTAGKMNTSIMLADDNTRRWGISIGGEFYVATMYLCLFYEFLRARGTRVFEGIIKHGREFYRQYFEYFIRISISYIFRRIFRSAHEKFTVCAFHNSRNAFTHR